MRAFPRLLAGALRALPGTLRDRVGDDVRALCLRRVADARRRGRLPALATAAGCLIDLLLRGAYERLRRPDARPTHDTAGAGSAGRTHPENIMDSFVADLRHAVRALARTPRFTAAVLLTLGLGIGANTAIFSVVDGVMLRGLPFPDADRFVHVGHDYGGGPSVSMPYYRLDFLRDGTRSFEALATYRGDQARVEVDGRYEGVEGLRVDGDFRRAVGYPLALGRWFTDEELAPEGPAAVVVSHATWRTRFGGTPDALGRTLTLDERPYTVVGVLPPDFAFPQAAGRVQYLVPLGLRPDPRDEGRNYPAVARLAPGVTPEAAEADLAGAWASFREAHPDLVGDPERGPVLTTYQELHVGNLRTVLWVAMGAVAVVLLIACANVANLLLARAAGRQRDVAVRAALGATRGRIVRYVLTESLLLSLLAAALGVVFARWGVDALLALAPSSLPRAEGVGMNGRVLAFTLLAATGTGVLFGLSAALPAARARLGAVLRDGSRGNTGGQRVRQALILAQAALSVVLLVGAGLLLGTLRNLQAVDTGFDPDGVVAVSFPIQPPGYGAPEPVADLVQRVEAALVGDPAVAGVAGASTLPLQRGLNLPMAVAGRPEASEGAVEWRAVGPGYFDLLGIDVRAGRAFTSADGAGAPPVVVVNEAFARHWFPDGPALGRRIEIGTWRGRYIHPSLDVPAAEIVGVVADVRDRSLKEEPRRTLYVPFSQVPEVLTTFPVFLARTTAPAAGTAALRAALQDADPRLPTAEIRPMDRVVAGSLAQERFNALLLAAFAALALVLTALGIYGVISYAVGQRTREIGIRVALGAGRGEVVRMVVAQGMAPVVLGLGLGAAASLWLTRLVAGLVWGVAPNDPATLAAGGAILLVVALVASWLPARRATGVDPVRTLASE